MSSIRKSWWGVLALAVAFAGCDSAATTTPSGGAITPNPGPPVNNKPADAKPAETKPVVPEKKVDLEKVKLNDEQVAAIKKLDTPEEQKIALEQKICPSSGDNLGEMGKPIKVVLKDQVVFLCCGSCVKDAKANPDAMLAKIGKK